LLHIGEYFGFVEIGQRLAGIDYVKRIAFVDIIEAESIGIEHKHCTPFGSAAGELLERGERIIEAPESRNVLAPGADRAVLVVGNDIQQMRMLVLQFFEKSITAN
jgi:hypothetical protein